MEKITHARQSEKILTLRCELAQAERQLRIRAERDALRLARAERIAWREAQDACFVFDRIRQGVKIRREHKLAAMALRDADRADAAYTVISFARLRERLCYLRGGSERDAVIRETLERGGVYTDGFGGRHFREIVR